MISPIKRVINSPIQTGLSAFFLLAFSSIFFKTSLADQPLNIQLGPAGQVASYRIQLEFAGELKLLPTEEEPDGPTLPLNVEARFEFDQNTIDQQQTVRHYKHAAANITIDGNSVISELAEHNRQITTSLNDRRFTRAIQITSTGGFLKQSEKDLLTYPADPASLPGLLKAKNVKPGEKWVPSDEAVEAFLALDNVIQNEVSLMIKQADPSEIKIYILGDVVGEVDGGTAQFTIVGVAVIDPLANLVSALRLNIDEKRDATQIAPGFKGKQKIDIRSELMSTTAPPQFRKASVARNDSETTRLLWNTDSEFELIYDQRWRVILSDSDAVILRYVDKGELLAQCNIIQLPKRPPDRPFTLKDFQGEIEKILVDADAKIVSGDTITTANGLTSHRIAIEGVQDDVPILWIYHHVRASTGQRVAMIFTVEQQVAAIFLDADRRLVDSLRFVKPANGQ